MAMFAALNYPLIRWYYDLFYKVRDAELASDLPRITSSDRLVDDLQLPIFEFALVAVGSYVYFVANVNRLHYIDKSGWRLAFVYAPLILPVMVLAAAMSGRAALLQIDPALTVYIQYGLTLISWLAAFLLFIECGFFSGDEHGNRFGRAPREN